MRKFLIQTVNKKLIYDFTFEMNTCEEYYKWLNRPIKLKKYEGIDFDKIKRPDQYIPVGSVEFVSVYLKKFYPDAIKALEPINVPEQLFPFAGRTITNITKPEDLNIFNNTSHLYTKSMTTIKHPNNGWIDLPDFDRCKDCQVSTPIDNIISEWRVFVFNDVIMDAKNYMGDFFICPDKEIVSNMVKTYKNSPKAYTLDVAVTSKGETVVIECHRFFSCGTYGFCSGQPDIYPVMLSQEWFEMKNMR